MGLGRTGRSADAVTARAAAEQDDLVTRDWRLTPHVIGGGGTHHGANLHALGRVTRMVQLVDLTRGKADLVAVARVAMRRRRHDLALGQLARKRLGNGRMRVSGTRHAHGLVHVGATGQRIADATANARCRATEGLDLGGMVVRLVLEEEQPVLILTVDVNLDLDGAGVDLLAFVEAREDALALEVLRTDGAHVHEANGLLVTSKLVAHVQIRVEGGLDDLVIYLDIGELGAKGGMAAVVGPVGVDHLHLGDGRVTMLDVGKVILEDLDIRQIHCQATFANEDFQDLVIIIDKVLDNLDVGWFGILRLERLDLIERGLARLDGVNDIVLNGSDVIIAQIALEQVQRRATHFGALAARDELNALARRICPLVKLTGQVLDGKEHGIVGKGG